MISEFPRPVCIGCVRCGDLLPDHQTVYIQCPTCGKHVGLCRACSKRLPRNFLPDSMAWHMRVHHADREQALGICADLFEQGHPWRHERRPQPVADEVL